MVNTKHIVCYSGGHSSALVAIEVTRRYGKENVILLNHNINSRFENEDIKRFKKEVADYLGLPITYANHENQLAVDLIKNQFEVCIKKGSFVNPANRQILCTFVLKTEPFYKFLKELPKEDKYIIYYGFDSNEPSRIERRESILKEDGYDSDYPLALWLKELVDVYNDYLISDLLKVYNKVNKTKTTLIQFKNNNKEYIDKAIDNNLIKLKEHKSQERTIFSTEDIGIKKPNTYSVWKHANCIGCLKAGQQHWYCVYVHDYEVFQMGKNSEEIIGHSFGKEFLKDVEPKFKRMKDMGIPANEHIDRATFWKSAKHYLKQSAEDLFPCECFV